MTEHRIATIDQLHKEKGFEAEINGREIVLWKVKNKVYCIDNKCWHASSPLHYGDIEEYDGRTCIVCPMHKYIIDLATGEDILVMERKGLAKIFNKKPLLDIGAVKQRTHITRVADNGDVFVTLSARTSKAIASDDNYPDLPEDNTAAVTILYESDQ